MNEEYKLIGYITTCMHDNENTNIDVEDVRNIILYYNQYLNEVVGNESK